MRKEKMIDYKRLDSSEKKMYDKLDNYLGINKKKQPRKIIKFLRFCSGLAACMVLYWVVLAVMAYFDIGAKAKTICFVSIFSSYFCSFLAYLTSSGGHEKAKLSERSPQLELVEKIMEKDGLQTVYEDFASAKKLKDADVMVGKRYIFAAHEGMVRIADVEDVTVSTAEPERVSVLINDENGGLRLNISAFENVCGEEKREKLEQLADEIAGMTGFGLMMPTQDEPQKNEKYELVDEFLDLSEKPKYDKTLSFKKSKPYVIAAKFFIAAGFAFLALRTDGVFFLGTCAALLSLFDFGSMGIFDNNRNWQKDIFRDLSKNMISEDGLDAVYDDLIETEHIKDTSIYVGRRYLFVRERFMLRLEDIENIVMYSTIVRGDIYGYVVNAETADRSLTLTALPKNDKERKQLFDDIRIAIRDARLPLTGTEPGMKYVTSRDR